MHYLLIDGDSVVRRAIMAAADEDRKAGVWRGGIRAAFYVLHEAVYVNEPDRVVVAFDHGTPAFRRKLWPEYKQKRREKAKLTPDERKLAYKQVDTVRDLLPLLGVRVMRYENHEADDLLASATAQLVERGDRVTIATSDKDLWQLLRLGSSVEVYDLSERKTIRRKHLYKRFGVEPRELVLLRAMAGDSSDGLPGVRSVGEAKAAAMIQLMRENEPEWKDLSTLGMLDLMVGRYQEAIKTTPDAVYKYEAALVESVGIVRTMLAVMDLTESTAPRVKERLLLDCDAESKFQRKAFMRAARKYKIRAALGDPIGFLEPFKRAV